MLRSYAAFGFAVAAILSSFSASTFAGSVVSDGLALSFSPRGQTYFRENLNSVLLANKLDLANNHWNEIKFVLNQPFEGSEPVETLHARLAPYFYGFPINPPRLELRLASTDLTVKFRSMGAVIDPAGPSAYGMPRSKGAVVLLRMEGEDLAFDAKTLRIVDLANPDLLGTVGADALSIAQTDGGLRTVKAEIPVLVEADGKRATMRILAIRTNLERAAFDLRFAKLLLPSIKTTINGKDYVFDQAAFEKDLRSRLPQLGVAIVAAVKTYFEHDGKALVQAQFDALASNLNVDFKLPLPDDSAKLFVHLRPSRVEYGRSPSVGIAFDSAVNDRATDSVSLTTPEIPGGTNRSFARTVGSGDYDVALTLRPTAINAALESVWAKGALRDIDLGKDDSGRPTKVKIPKSPIVTLAGLPTANQANFHAWIGYVVHGIGGILFKGPIPIELDLIVKMETNAKNEIEVVLDHIDESTLKVDTRATWLWPIRGKVNALVRSKIADLNASAAKKRMSLVSLPTLDALLGIPLRLDSATNVDGNLVLLADFAPKP